jgi:hypothetical protein
MRIKLNVLRDVRALIKFSRPTRAFASDSVDPVGL